MGGLLVFFLSAAAVLWLSVFGYLLALRAAAARRRITAGEPESWPKIAIVVPMRDEADLIAAKLADLRRTDYPADRREIVLVDGGSTDGTVAAVEGAIAAGDGLRLLQVSASRGKAHQVRYALERIDADVVVVTDVDGVLDPSCIRELVRVLSSDPSTAIVGARVRPGTALLEERVYWWLVNKLWWLEGEVLSAAMVSGVCYAARRRHLRLWPDGPADDVQVSTLAVRGGGVRLCALANATEVRVPHSPSEILDFRRRRGGHYVRELLRWHGGAASPGSKLARAIRLWHFLVAPKVALVLLALGLFLLWSDHWVWTLATFAAFAVPALLLVAHGASEETDEGDWRRIGLATARLVGLTWLALLTLTRAVPAYADASTADGVREDHAA
jgi:glycosyltransferase involved in cell wall biosynthesis